MEDEIIQETKQEMKHIEGRVGRALTMFGNRTRADTGNGKRDCERDHDLIYNQWYNWLRNTKQRNLDSAEGRTSADECSCRRRCGNQAAMLERTAFLNFDGKQEKWSEFTRTFKESIKESGQGPVMEMAMLSAMIPEEARRLITGITNLAEACERLNELYRDKKLAFIAAIKDLMQLKMPPGLPFEKTKP